MCLASGVKGLETWSVKGELGINTLLIPLLSLNLGFWESPSLLLK